MQATKRRGRIGGLARLGGGVLLLLGGGGGDPDALGQGAPTGAGGAGPQVREWREGTEIRLRVPLATETHELMSAVSFPETTIRSAVTGWGESTLTSVQKGNYLFLRLSRRAEGQLNVIGESGTHYLLYLQAVE